VHAPLASKRRHSWFLPETTAPGWPITSVAPAARARRLDVPCIHESFALQVTRSPYAVAVVDGDRRLTYREIDARANQLAHHLRRLGACREKDFRDFY
ncbi:MAG: AMP-binding protein, partial [Byssovorax sp.]